MLLLQENARNGPLSTFLGEPMLATLASPEPFKRGIGSKTKLARAPYNLNPTQALLTPSRPANPLATTSRTPHHPSVPLHPLPVPPRSHSPTPYPRTRELSRANILHLHLTPVRPPLGSSSSGAPTLGVGRAGSGYIPLFLYFAGCGAALFDGRVCCIIPLSLSLFPSVLL